MLLLTCVFLCFVWIVQQRSLSLLVDGNARLTAGLPAAEKISRPSIRMVESITKQCRRYYLVVASDQSARVNLTIGERQIDLGDIKSSTDGRLFQIWCSLTCRANQSYVHLFVEELSLDGSNVVAQPEHVYTDFSAICQKSKTFYLAVAPVHFSDMTLHGTHLRPREYQIDLVENDAGERVVHLTMSTLDSKNKELTPANSD